MYCWTHPCERWWRHMVGDGRGQWGTSERDGLPQLPLLLTPGIPGVCWACSRAQHQMITSQKLCSSIWKFQLNTVRIEIGNQSVQTWLLGSSYSIILNVWQLIAKLTLVLDLNFEMKLSMQDCCERIKVKCFKNMTFFFFSLKILQSVVFMHNLIFSCKQALTE